MDWAIMDNLKEWVVTALEAAAVMDTGDILAATMFNRRPAEEAWRNINAINDLIYEIIITDTHLVISAVLGNAAAGGFTMALAADYVYACDGIVLNPHYKTMGLYGSEY